MRELVSGFDGVIVLVLFFIIYLYCSKVQEDNIETYHYYSHFKRAVLVKLLFGLLFACVYIFYYDGGDTQYYYTGARSIVRIAKKDFFAFIQLMAGERTPELRSLFDYTTGWPTYFKDANSWAVCRFSVPFYLLGCGSYLGMTLMMDALLFIPMWRFYRMIIRIYPRSQNYAAFALFYVPSVCFWGSGLLKDIWCLVGVLSVYYSCWMVFVRRKKVFGNIFRYLVWAYILTSIRPYAFYTVFATSVVWIALVLLRRLNNKMIQVAFFPLVAVFVIVMYAVFVDNMGDIAEGKYASVGSMMEQAVIIQDDLKRDYYGTNSFDIGTFDASISGMLSKTPQALMAGLFRPFLWEARTPFMLLSGVENFFLLVLSLLVLFKMRLNLIRTFIDDAFLFSFALFVIAFGFFIGLTIANFGALVRYRIILLPFLVIILFRLRYLYKKAEEDDDEEEEEFVS